jgi:hypothetical protein
MNAAEFVGTLFLARDVAHSVHLNTTLFRSGKYGLIGPISLMSAKKTTNIIEFLQNQADEIEEKRYAVVDKDCTPLQNIIDEILGQYFSTLYKLRFLA